MAINISINTLCMLCCCYKSTAQVTPPVSKNEYSLSDTNYIKAKLMLPDNKDNCVLQGYHVDITYTVDKKGEVKNIVLVANTYCSYTETVIILAILNLKYMPAKKKGRRVPYKMHIPIDIKAK